MNTKAATTSRLMATLQTTSTAPSVLVHTPPVIPKKIEAKDKQDLESAVFAYIQAMRAMGRNKLNTVDIAQALGCKPSDVEQTLASLRPKGVKKAK
jgi:hypothetical protein